MNTPPDNRQAQKKALKQGLLQVQTRLTMQEIAAECGISADSLNSFLRRNHLSPQKTQILEHYLRHTNALPTTDRPLRPLTDKFADTLRNLAELMEDRSIEARTKAAMARPIGQIVEQMISILDKFDAPEAVK